MPNNFIWPYSFSKLGNCNDEQVGVDCETVTCVTGYENGRATCQASGSYSGGVTNCVAKDSFCAANNPVVTNMHTRVCINA